LIQATLSKLSKPTSRIKEHKDSLPLPVRHGGMGLIIPTNSRERHFQTSVKICEPLVSLILQQDASGLLESQLHQREEKKVVHQSNRQLAHDDAVVIHSWLSKSQQAAIDQANEKGASSWLSTKISTSCHGSGK
jgi:hypothetical protein